MKHCPKCGKDRPLSCFCANRANPDGLQSRCRECHNAEKRAEYAELRDSRIAAHRRYNQTPQGRAAQKSSNERHKAKYPEKVRARKALNHALESGRISRKPCEFEGCGETKVEAHHDDYSRPLDVKWFCHFHHRLIEGRIAA